MKYEQVSVISTEKNENKYVLSLCYRTRTRYYKLQQYNNYKSKILRTSRYRPVVVE